MSKGTSIWRPIAILVVGIAACSCITIAEDIVADVMSLDDECSPSGDGAGCALNELQLRASKTVAAEGDSNKATAGFWPFDWIFGGGGTYQPRTVPKYCDDMPADTKSTSPWCTGNVCQCGQYCPNVKSDDWGNDPGCCGCSHS
mmetsp:Transcript_80309/g.209146  ORF Transcript_80309/g.209146 Transcript_80309/m.209146 type:complete len:144 (-) Transcript_80309:127-558(-)